MKLKDYIIYLVIILVIILGLSTTLIIIRQKEIKKTPLDSSDSILVVPTLLDKLNEDSTWVPTFQLIWNDLLNDICKGKLEINPSITMVDNLNEETFTENMLSDEYYYKVYGLKTLELKSEIEKSIKEKFNQTSDILDMFDWSDDELYDPNNENMKRYFLYTMLYREFEYTYKFDKLEKSNFKDINDIEYFGIDNSTDSKVREQIRILFYENDDNFAISIKTKSNDEVIYYKNPKGSTFKEILDNFNKSKTKYKGNNSLGKKDLFKAPALNINLLKEYKELENIEFTTGDPAFDKLEIVKALQTVKFEINEKGGKIKSEAAMDVKNYASSSIEETPKHLYLDNTFVIMLKEESKDTPYFMARIDDIKKFQ